MAQECRRAPLTLQRSILSSVSVCCLPLLLYMSVTSESPCPTAVVTTDSRKKPCPDCPSPTCSRCLAGASQPCQGVKAPMLCSSWRLCCGSGCPPPVTIAAHQAVLADVHSLHGSRSRVTFHAAIFHPPFQIWHLGFSVRSSEELCSLPGWRWRSRL